jgi:hypothetical protein
MKTLIALLLLISSNANAAFCTSITGNHGSANGRPVSEYYTDGLPSMQDCSDFVLLTAVEYTVINEKAKQVDSVDKLSVEGVTVAFSFGMSTYALFWFVGYKGRLARKAVAII